MKIYKVQIDRKNPITKIVKVPAGSDYGLNITRLDGGELTSFNNINIADAAVCTMFEKDSTLSDEKTLVVLNLPKVNVGEEITFVYGTVDYGFSKIKVVGVETDDYDIGGGSSGSGTTYTYITENANSGCIQIGCWGMGEILMNTNVLEMNTNGTTRFHTNGFSVTDTCNITIQGDKEINLKTPIITLNDVLTIESDITNCNGDCGGDCSGGSSGSEVFGDGIVSIQLNTNTRGSNITTNAQIVFDTKGSSAFFGDCSIRGLKLIANNWCVGANPIDNGAYGISEIILGTDGSYGLMHFNANQFFINSKQINIDKFIEDYKM